MSTAIETLPAIQPRLSVNSAQVSSTASTPTASPTFDAATHLAYVPPMRVVSMEDLALPPSPVSGMAATDPFPLLSYEAVLAHRRELFQPAVLDRCAHQQVSGAAMLRGMSPKYTPFVHALWTSPALTNVQLGAEGMAGMRQTPAQPVAADPADMEGANNPSSHQSALVRWHKDSYPFVCVVMLSDARGMLGGETVLRTGRPGETMRVRAPQMGGAVLLQGRRIEHVALPATNMGERITVVTSFRPRDPLLVDETTLLNVRTESHRSELYYQWVTYRLGTVAARVAAYKAALDQQYIANVAAEDGVAGMCRTETVTYDEIRLWVEDQVAFLQQTVYEMRPLDEKDP